jgi:hypothetical protein
MPSNSDYIRATTLDYLPLGATKGLFNRAAARDKGLQALRDKAVAEGFTPISGKESNWGMTASWTSNDGRTLSFDFHMETYKRGSDQGCVITQTLHGSKRDETTTYRSFLVAPKGNYQRVSEFYADTNNKVRLAHSKWSAFGKCVKGRCVGPCIAALAACTGSFWAYVACVAIACGGCMAGCAACALCGCSWWCKWAVGCCKG